MTDLDFDTLSALSDAERTELFNRLDPPQKRLLRDLMLEHVKDIDPLAGIDWREWNKRVVPNYIQANYAPHHEHFWQWVDNIGPDRPQPFAALWPRGHAKSACAEVAVIKLGAQQKRKYCLYVSHTADQADDHVQNIAAMLESRYVTETYPALGQVKLNKWGTSKGWRRNRVRTAAGLTIDALGLDVAARGARLEEERPDMMVLDDIDATHASTRVVERNIRTITQALIPALQPNKVIILAQNTVAPNSIASRLAAGTVDMLGGAIMSGPFPAVEGLEAERRFDERIGQTRWYITAGTPTWPGWMGLRRCEEQLIDMGMLAFKTEVQQDTSERPGAIWRADEIQYWKGELPELERVIVAVDPNKTGRSDDAGVVKLGAATINGELHAFVLDDLSQLELPSKWRDGAWRAALKAPRAGSFVVESAGLGEHAELTLKGSRLAEGHSLPVRDADASLGKKDRARPVWQLYVDGRVWHAASMPYLEGQLTGWEPDVDPVSPGALDALVHGVTHLLIDPSGAPNIGAGL